MDISSLKHAMKMLIGEVYPFKESFSEELYSLEDVVNQLIFEIIKEEYKKYAERKTITDFLGQYDVDASNRKYTRAIQYAQHYRDYDNNLIENEFGIRVPEIEAQDLSGSKVFSGHRITEHEFLGLKMQAECALLNKLHEGQIESSKKVSETKFKELFSDYANRIDDLEPPINRPESVICNTFVYFGIESYFLTEFIYRLTLAAEKVGFPRECPTDRILNVCAITPVIPETFWCPTTFIANFYMIPKWDHFCVPIFVDSDEEWSVKNLLLHDCKHIKDSILQKNLNKLIEKMHDCTVKDKASFIEENYWIWDKRVEYEWTSERIKYYRKIHALIKREFPKPHIK